MKRRQFLTIAACLTLPSLLTACAGRTPLVTEGYLGGLTPSEVYRCIVQAGKKRKWVVAKIDDHHLEATYRKAYHVAVLDITLEQDSYQISVSPKTSSSLRDEDGKVHRKVNQWMELLKADIDRTLQEAELKKTSI